MMRAALVGGGTIVGVGVVLGLNPSGAPVGALGFPLIPAGSTTQDGAVFGPSAGAAGNVTAPATPSPSRSTGVPAPSRAPTSSVSHSSSRVTNSPVHASPPPSTGRPSPAATPTPASTTALGDAVDVGYGIVQVQATVASGRLVDIQPVQMPLSDPGSYSRSVSAWPVLKQEALQAQSAQIAGYSGATYTSEGFAQSLRAALLKLGHSA